jgi:hypothetical protein
MFGIGIPELIIIFIIIFIIFFIPVSIAICVLLLTRHGPKKSIIREGYMYCTKCGTKNDDNAFKCVQCGNILQDVQQSGTGTPEKMVIPTYLAQAILVTLFCCLPFGIPAIVYAAQVNSRFAAGDYTGAVEKSKKAKTWCWVAFWVGLGLLIINVLIGVIGAFIGA